jgi:hypothetical protein
VKRIQMRRGVKLPPGARYVGRPSRWGNPYRVEQPSLLRTRMDPELGLVRVCTRCRDEWPLDSEFFPRGQVDGFHSWCRACWAEYSRERRRRAAA